MIEITMIRNKYPLWLREKEGPEGSKWFMLDALLDNTTTLGELTKLLMKKHGDTDIEKENKTIYFYIKDCPVALNDFQQLRFLQ